MAEAQDIPDTGPSKAEQEVLRQFENDLKSFSIAEKRRELDDVSNRVDYLSQMEEELQEEISEAEREDLPVRHLASELDSVSDELATETAWQEALTVSLRYEPQAA